MAQGLRRSPTKLCLGEHPMGLLRSPSATQGRSYKGLSSQLRCPLARQDHPTCFQTHALLSW